MNTYESPTVDQTAAALQKLILDTVATVRRTIGRTVELSTIESRTRDFFQALSGLDEFLAGVRDNRDLSDEGKMKRRAQRLAELGELRNEAIADIVEAVSDFQARNRDAITVQPPERDPMLLEAKLGNARSDARMMFDAEPVNMLPLAFHQHAVSERNPLVTYLLLGTSWSDDYLAARKAPAHTMSDWEHRKTVAYPAALTPEQREALEAMKRLEKIEQTLVHAYTFFVRDRNLGALA